MSKSQSFSIYLLKKSYSGTNALKDDHKLNNYIPGGKLPEGATLYLLDNPPREPWWKDYFGIHKNLKQSLKGAIVFLVCEDRTFAITFGHVYHNLKEESYEYDFGLRVVLNCVDPDKIKSTDVLKPNGSKRQRTQLPISSDLTYFDFDQDTTILNRLTGTVKEEYKLLFNHVSGASNIRVSSKKTSQELPILCEGLLSRYMDESYKKIFPNIRNISPVGDPEIIFQLNIKLIEAIKSKNQNLSLSFPEIVDYKDEFCITFFGAGRGFVDRDVSIEAYYNYLELHCVDLESISVEILKKHTMVLTNEDGNNRIASYSIFKCMIFDCEIFFGEENKVFHLCDGCWHEINADFVNSLSGFLDPFFVSSRLPAFNHKNEGDYNNKISESQDRLFCLDTKNIAPKKQKGVEPCDIFEIFDNKAILHHIKISTISSKLSHLFNQGINSITLLLENDQSKIKLINLLKNKVVKDQIVCFSDLINAGNFKVVFSVITKKDPIHKSKNLPLFSRISLMRILKSMKILRGVEAEFCFIKDERPPSNGKKKNKASDNKNLNKVVSK